MDEHGQKIQKTAETKDLTALELCDSISILFKKLNVDLNVDYDRFIRTTEDDHKNEVYNIFKKCLDNGDIYLGEYVGWYDAKEETFVSETEASKTNYTSPNTQTPYIKMKESSYFFRLSKYHDSIMKHLQNNKDFIIGSNDILYRLKDQPLSDISISRTTIDWGIPIPLKIINEHNVNSENAINIENNTKHVFYVWFDALTNYITGCPDGFWPPNIQIIGKDIVWFHSVIWIGMLMSAKLDLPNQLLVHSFINDKNGKKMSKSLGNVVSPTDLIEKYPPSAIRYYLLKENILQDVCFSEESLIRCHDNDLLPNLGNLVHRVFSMFHRYCNSTIPEESALELFNIDNVYTECSLHIKNAHFHMYCEQIFKMIHSINTHINETKLWEIGKKDKDMRTAKDRNIIMKTLLESLYIIGHFLYPIMPDVTDSIVNKYLDCSYTTIPKLSWENLVNNTILEKKNTILFTILDKSAYETRKQRMISKK